MKSIACKQGQEINCSPALIKVTLLWTVLALLGGSAVSSLASDPVGIYAFVDKVVLEPSEGSPERIQVWGGFALAEGGGDQYSPAQRGYMYFKLKPGKETICQNEWNDLKSVAGTRQVVGFGASWGAKVHVRKSEGDANLAEEFPMGNGLVKVNADQPRAAALLEYKDR